MLKYVIKIKQMYELDESYIPWQTLVFPLMA